MTTTKTTPPAARTATGTPRGESQTPRPPASKPLVSRSTILILSSFLVGVAVHHVLPPELEHYVLATGLVGLLSYLALDVAAARRRERRDELDRLKAANKFEGRLNRHLPAKTQPRSSPAASSSAEESEWQQFVTVADNE